MIQNQNCFAHFMHRFEEFRKLPNYICGFKIDFDQWTRNIYNDDGPRVAFTGRINRTVSHKFIKQLLYLFPNVKKISYKNLTRARHGLWNDITKQYGPSRPQKADWRNFVFFETNPASWSNYAAFSLFFSAVRFLEEYPWVVSYWGEVDKKVKDKLDFFQKLTIAHIFLGDEIPTGHNVYDSNWIWCGKQTIENVTWPMLEKHVKKNTWPYQFDDDGVVVGKNCSLVPKDVDYYRPNNRPNMRDIKEFNLKEFTNKCTDQ